MIARLKQILNKLFTNPHFIHICSNLTNDKNGFVLLDQLLRSNSDIYAIQQAATAALQMADIYQLVANCILMNDEYSLIKNISMGGLSSTQTPTLNTQQPTLSGIVDGVGQFINTINDTAKTVLQLFQ